ncbi:aldo/keto reductase [candidate division KSB1 bacterium]
MDSISRRGFIKRSSAAAAGCAIPLSHVDKNIQAQELPVIKRYKPFGKTGWMVSDISAGSGQREPGFVQSLYERGINFIDSARQYSNHEEVIGQCWGNVPREKMFIVSKWMPNQVKADTTKAELMVALDESLKRLNTTYIDCFMIHSMGNPAYGGLERIQNPAIYEAWDEAKKLGKIKFTGASSHSVNMLNEIGWGIDNDRFEVVLVGANFLTKGLEPLLQKARAKGVATMAMKTMTIYKSDLNIRELQNRNTNARQAVLKWVLASDLFDTVVIGMGNYDVVNEYLSVSGTTSLTEEDNSLLQTVSAHVSGKYCRPGCSGCVGSCPNNVPVWDVLRYKMYFENYGREKYAMGLYKNLPQGCDASKCKTCTAPCERSCTYNIAVRDQLIEAHDQLSTA